MVKKWVSLGEFTSYDLNNKEKEYLKIVYDECKRLSRLVNSFLEVTRNLNQKIELEITDFDINRLITRTALGFEKIIDEKNIKVDIENSEIELLEGA